MFCYGLWCIKLIEKKTLVITETKTQYKRTEKITRMVSRVTKEAAPIQVGRYINTLLNLIDIYLDTTDILRDI